MMGFGVIWMLIIVVLAALGIVALAKYLSK